MNSTHKAVEVSPQTTRTKFDGVLLTIRSRKSYFQVTRCIGRRDRIASAARGREKLLKRTVVWIVGMGTKRNT
jgi:hypothetical protein